MRRERWATARFITSAVAAASCAVLLTACPTLTGQRTRDATPTPPVDRAATEGTLVSGYLTTLLKMSQGTAAEQAELLAATKNEYGAAPTPSRVLRYALVLATPGHGGFDPVGAQRLLREVVANPETLLPAERALAQLQLATIDQHQALRAEVKRAQSDNDRSDRDRIATLNRRLAAEADENARLKRALEEAQAKLDAIAKIEQGLNNRPPPPEGRNP
jgi:hypothetical protein